MFFFAVTVTCGKEIKNNLTYFVSPEFPSLSRSMASCNLYLKKTEGVSQLRLDFIHFSLVLHYYYNITLLSRISLLNLWQTLWILTRKNVRKLWFIIDYFRDNLIEQPVIVILIYLPLLEVLRRLSNCVVRIAVNMVIF